MWAREQEQEAEKQRVKEEEGGEEAKGGRASMLTTAAAATWAPAGPNVCTPLRRGGRRVRAHTPRACDAWAARCAVLSLSLLLVPLLAPEQSRKRARVRGAEGSGGGAHRERRSPEPLDASEDGPAARHVRQQAEDAERRAAILLDNG